jgi:Gas vesicle synthesis protein GvpL/GvpF
VPDELDRWAATRAPELLARAEAEAVYELKRALLRAALARRADPTGPAEARRPDGPTATGEARRSRRPTAAAESRQPDRPTAAGPEAAPSPTGHGLWAYCVTRTTDPPAVNGVHRSPVERIEERGLAVLVSRVPLGEFGEDALRRNLNDLDWLERVARDHEAVLDRALELGTIVPLRICTIFADEDGASRMLAEQRSSLDTALDVLDGRQEWGVKLTVDRQALEAAARERAPDAFGDELEGQSPGGAYMLRRRQERQLREVADRLAGGLAEDVHARLQDWATDAVVNPPQNPELSGHEGDMLLNAAYLVEAEKVDRLHELVAELRERHRALGARLELTGPWPPYNFVPRTESALA